MCEKCHKKENLKLPIPENIDMIKFNEYKQKRETNQLNPQIIFNYFLYFFGGNWAKDNPKQIRRAFVNMDDLYFTYKDKKISVGDKRTLKDKYLYELQYDGSWVLIEQGRGILPKDIKTIYTNKEFNEL